MRLLRVGLDLVPAAFPDVAPGTARYVTGQIKALLALDCAWNWVVAASATQISEPWLAERARCVTVRPARSRLRGALVDTGNAWRKGACSAGLAAAYISPLGNLPVVANVFDSNIFDRKETRSMSLASLLFRVCVSMTVRKASRLFVLSEYCRRRLQTVFPRQACKFVAVPTGVDSLAVGPDREPSWWPYAASRFCFFAGAFSDNKNQAGLLRAWQRVQMEDEHAPKLILAGPCTEEYKQRVILPLVGKLARPQDVFIAGFIDDAALSWLFRHAFFYVHPSFCEGFGLPVAEAMLYGLPVVCSNTSSLPETAGDAALFFAPDDGESIAAAVRLLVQRSDIRSDIVEKGHKRVACFSWERNAEIVAACMEDSFRA